MESRTTISMLDSVMTCHGRPWRRSGCFSSFSWHALPPGPSPTPRPADDSVRLVPPDVAVVVTVDGLRDQTNTFLKSRLAADLRRLPAVKAWLASEKYRHFERSRAQIETLLART